MAVKAISRKASKKTAFSLISDDKLRQLYAAMLQLRVSKGRRSKLRNSEAVISGAAIDLQSGDLVFAQDGALAADCLPWDKKRNSVPVVPAGKNTSLLAMSVGAAMGVRAAGKQGVVVAICDAESEQREVWRTSLLIAGRQRLPILFVLMLGTAGAERLVAAISADAMDATVMAIPVDTADAVAIYRVAFESLARARRGTGATLMVATRYKVEGNRRETKDPVAHMKAYLRNKGISLFAKKT